MSVPQEPLGAPRPRDRVVLGVIGGSGVYDAAGGGFSPVRLRRVEVETPYGRPSAPAVVGELEREGASPLPVVFLPRHGDGHVLLPSEIPYRANICAMRMLGVTHLVAVSAVGSLQEEIAPGHLVLVDQFIDRTTRRANTFFGDGVVAHVPFGDPVDPGLHGRLQAAAEEVGHTFHERGTCVVIEGPSFSTRAESQLYRSVGAHVVGMTALPEARLAREAEIAYVMLAMATDYDCWRDEEPEVRADAVLDVLRANVGRARDVLGALARFLPEDPAELPTPSVLGDAVVTRPDRISSEARARLRWLLEIAS